jgi:hypothetical protein
MDYDKTAHRPASNRDLVNWPADIMILTQGGKLNAQSQTKSDEHCDILS